MAEYVSFADKVAKYKCPGTQLVHLTRAQIRALHKFRTEFAASLEQLYQTMEPEKADAFLKPLLRKLTD